MFFRKVLLESIINYFIKYKILYKYKFIGVLYINDKDCCIKHIEFLPIIFIVDCLIKESDLHYFLHERGLSSVKFLYIKIFIYPDSILQSIVQFYYDVFSD